MPNKNNELLSFTPEGDELIAHYKGCRVSIHTPSRPGHREMQAILTIKIGDVHKTTVQYFGGSSFAIAAQRVIAWVDQKRELYPLKDNSASAKAIEQEIDLINTVAAESLDLLIDTAKHHPFEYADGRQSQGSGAKLWAEVAPDKDYDDSLPDPLKDIEKYQLPPIKLDPKLAADWGLIDWPKCKDCPSKDTCTLRQINQNNGCAAHTDDHERDNVQE